MVPITRELIEQADLPRSLRETLPILGMLVRRGKVAL